jgi:hypothetical protein
MQSNRINPKETPLIFSAKYIMQTDGMLFNPQNTKAPYKDLAGPLRGVISVATENNVVSCEKHITFI